MAIALKLGAHPLVIFTCAGVGALSNAMGAIICDNALIQWAATASDGEAGHIFYSAGPAGAFFAVIIAAEIGKAISKETKVDILVTPFVTIFAGVCVSYVIAPPIGSVANAFGTLINTTTQLQPFWMGIAVSGPNARTDSPPPSSGSPSETGWTLTI